MFIKHSFGLFSTVDPFLNLSCSALLPGGARNKEYALHALCKSNGNIEVIVLR